MLITHLYDENTIFLFGNHDPRIFPVSFEMEIQGFKFLFQHSLTYHNNEGIQLTINGPVSTHFTDVMEEKWKNDSVSKFNHMFGPLKEPFSNEQDIKPLFILPDIDLSSIDIPECYDYIILGHLSSYEWLYKEESKCSSLCGKLFTIDSNNSSIVEYSTEKVHERRLQHYERRIKEVKEEIPTLKIKAQLRQMKLLEHLEKQLEHEKSGKD